MCSSSHSKPPGERIARLAEGPGCVSSQLIPSIDMTGVSFDIPKYLNSPVSSTTIVPTADPSGGEVVFLEVSADCSCVSLQSWSLNGSCPRTALSDNGRNV